jgi:hypothetical protein
MRCLAYLTLVFILTFSAGIWGKDMPSIMPDSAVTGSSVPDRAVPYPLRDFWLRFHELDLCQEVHATFAFHGGRMEVWCRVEDPKAFQRFTEMLNPLRLSYSIDLHVAEGPRGRRSLEEDDPPPSLWNNAELRQYFQGGPQIASAAAGAESTGEPEPRIILEQRLIMFAVQTLNWDRKMRRYGEELPVLAEAAFNTSAAPDTKSRAAAVCFLHAEALDKFVEKLNRNMTIALPRASKKSKTPFDSESIEKEKHSLEDSAVVISNASQDIARRIYLFINPQDFGVHLSDLRDPDLLESLKNLRSMLADFKLELLRQKESGR